MNKIIYLALIVIGVVACQKNDSPVIGKRITIVAKGSQIAGDTRISYDPEYSPDGNISNYSFQWNSTDHISLVVVGSPENKKNKLSVVKPGKSSYFTGGITTWIGEKDVVGIYPYSDQYTVNNGILENVSMVNQIILANTNNYSNSLMVATASGATAFDEHEYDIPTLFFKQVMCFIRFRVVAPVGSEIVNLKLSGAAIGTANVDVSTGQVSPLTSASDLFAVVNNSSKVTQANQVTELNFALFPTTLNHIGITFIDASGAWKYVGIGGTVFERGKIYAANITIDNWN